MALDLLLLMLSYLSSADATTLFNICLAGDILESKDNAVQKRGYKVLAKLVEGGKVDVNADDILKRLDGVADGLAAAAKKVRDLFVSLFIGLTLWCLSGSIHPPHSPSVSYSTYQPSPNSLYHP